MIPKMSSRRYYIKKLKSRSNYIPARIRTPYIIWGNVANYSYIYFEHILYMRICVCMCVCMCVCVCVCMCVCVCLVQLCVCESEGGKEREREKEKKRLLYRIYQLTLKVGNSRFSLNNLIFAGTLKKIHQRGAVIT